MSVRSWPTWLQRWMNGEQIGCSAGIAADEPTYGYDGPDDHGYFTDPVPDRFVARLHEHAVAYAERNGLTAQPSGGVLESLSDEERALIWMAFTQAIAHAVARVARTTYSANASVTWMMDEADDLLDLRSKLFPAPPGGEAPRETDSGGYEHD